MDRQRDKDAAHVHPGVVLARVWGLVRDRHALVSAFHSDKLHPPDCTFYCGEQTSGSNISCFR